MYLFRLLQFNKRKFLFYLDSACFKRLRRQVKKYVKKQQKEKKSIIKIPVAKRWQTLDYWQYQQKWLPPKRNKPVENTNTCNLKVSEHIAKLLSLEKKTEI